MIYIRYDTNLIPQGLLDEAEQAEAELEALPEDKREAFIKENGKIWQALKPYLAEMSYGKCWYSESPEVQSHMEVDHYRPKLEAIRAKGDADEGYRWLAFRVDNFRLSAQRSNKRSTNEETKEVEGKGAWFPVLEGRPKATWDNRCEKTERPVLLDPTSRTDVDLIEVDENGRLCPSQFCVGTQKKRVEESIKLYGLNLPKLVGARKGKMREINDIYQYLMSDKNIANAHPTVADALEIEKKLIKMRCKTFPHEPYSRAARSQMYSLGLGNYCAQPGDDYSPCV